MAESGRMRTVQGEIVFPTGDLPEATADVIVQVEDISRADAPAQVVGEQRLARVRLEPGGRLTFSIDVPADQVDEKHLYSVRVHADVAGSGEVRRGDLISTKTHPVLTRGHGDRTNVHLVTV